MGKDQVPLGQVGLPTWVSETVDLKYIALSKMLFLTLPLFSIYFTIFFIIIIYIYLLYDKVESALCMKSAV